jgi:hypothetical protein
MIIENICKLTPPESEFFEHVLGNSFPWFYQHVTRGYTIFSHVLSQRDPGEAEVPGNINSAYYDLCYGVFKKFCDAHNIPVNVVYRAAINCSEHTTDTMTDIHRDHDQFEHKNFIMYLNDFTGGNTYLFDDDRNLTYTIVPEKFKAVIFPGQNHANGFCGPGERRIAMIFTFN